MNDAKFDFSFLTGFFCISLYIYSSNIQNSNTDSLNTEISNTQETSENQPNTKLESQVQPYANQAKNAFISVIDGDTLKAKDQNGNLIKIRLASIDAPERDQPHGQEATAAITQLCSRAAFVYKPTGTDRYGRTVALVFCDGADVQAYMVKNGHAWVYDKYVGDAQYLYELQKVARITKKGLWRSENPMPPWSWRSSKG